MSETNLEAYNEAWGSTDKAKKESGGGARVKDVVPDGKYIAEISDVVWRTTRENGYPQLLWMLDIDDGPEAGKRVFKTNVLVKRTLQKNLDYLVKDLHACNYGELPARLEDIDRAKLQDTKVSITVKTGGSGHKDVYINRVVDADAASVGGLRTYNDDDIPF
jgi:hypothetical protein